MSHDRLHANACTSASLGDGTVLSRPETGVADPHSFGTAASAETARQDCPPVRPADRRTLRSWPLLFLALPAAVAVWYGWVGIGQMTGFG